jgi:hypothetical protein
MQGIGTRVCKGGNLVNYHAHFGHFIARLIPGLLEVRI